MTFPKSLSPETSNVNNVLNVMPFFWRTAFHFPLTSVLATDLEGLRGGAAPACSAGLPVAVGGSDLAGLSGGAAPACVAGLLLVACDTEVSRAWRSSCQIKSPIPAAIMTRSSTAAIPGLWSHLRLGGVALPAALSSA